MQKNDVLGWMRTIVDVLLILHHLHPNVPDNLNLHKCMHTVCLKDSKNMKYVTMKKLLFGSLLTGLRPMHNFLLMKKIIDKKPEGFIQSCNILLSKNLSSRLVLSLVRLCEISLNRLA